VDDNGTGGFDAAVNVLGDQLKTFAGTVTNSENSARAFWFAIRNAASKPTSFKIGSSSSLLVSVTPTDGGTVNLEPDSAPQDYTAESYKFYGLVLQPGDTYVSIS
jgi:hypothetical protein